MHMYGDVYKHVVVTNFVLAMAECGRHALRQHQGVSGGTWHSASLQSRMLLVIALRGIAQRQHHSHGRALTPRTQERHVRVGADIAHSAGRFQMPMAPGSQVLMCWAWGRMRMGLSPV